MEALESSWTKQLSKTDALESHERELIDENPRLEHELDTVRAEKERHNACDVESTKAVNDASVELTKANDTPHGSRSGNLQNGGTGIEPSKMLTKGKLT